jgi:CheY-like chemotaxis protein
LARKILLADDSVTAQNMGRKILTDAGYEVITVNNGSAALKKIAESKPDLIVLDVYMPGYSGLEVCQRIKENRETARIPVLLTVGKLEPFKPEEARRARADAFVVKPFEASELLAALTKLEDKIIPAPEPYKPGRFARAVASVDQDADEKFGDSDAGWKARLRIPTGPPKERDAEPDVDYAATQGKAFKDFEESSAAKDPAKPASKNGDFERPIPAGLPRDITPEEISAIAAAAAQLRGKKTDEVTPKPTARKAAVTPPEMPVIEAPEEAAPVTFASSPTLSEPQPEPISAAAAPDLSAVEVAPTDSENEAAVAPTEAATPIEAVSDTTISAAVPEFATTEVAAEIPELPVEAVAPPPDESPSIPAAQDEPETEAATPAAEEASVSSTDDEVMAALQTLMPTSSADSPTVPSLNESASTPVSEPTAVELPGHEAGPHWIAE